MFHSIVCSFTSFLQFYTIFIEKKSIVTCFVYVDNVLLLSKRASICSPASLPVDKITAFLNGSAFTYIFIAFFKSLHFPISFSTGFRFVISFEIDVLYTILHQPSIGTVLKHAIRDTCDTYHCAGAGPAEAGSQVEVIPGPGGRLNATQNSGQVEGDGKMNGGWGKAYWGGERCGDVGEGVR